MFRNHRFYLAKDDTRTSHDLDRNQYTFKFFLASKIIPMSEEMMDKKLSNMLEQHLSKLVYWSNHRDLRVKIILTKEATSVAVDVSVYSLQGAFLPKLLSVMTYEHVENCRARLWLRFSATLEGLGLGMEDMKIQIGTGLVPTSNPGGMYDSHIKYVSSSPMIKISQSSGEIWDPTCSDICLWVEGLEYEDLNSIRHIPMDVDMGAESSDEVVKIFYRDEVAVFGHLVIPRGILAAESETLSMLLEHQSRYEDGNLRISTNWPFRQTFAFATFLLTGNLSEAENDIDLAIIFYKIGQKYGMKRITKLMKTVILRIPPRRYTSESALCLLEVGRDEDEDLEKNAFDILNLCFPVEFTLSGLREDHCQRPFPQKRLKLELELASGPNLYKPFRPPPFLPSFLRMRKPPVAYRVLTY